MAQLELQPEQAKFLVPWFFIRKMDKGKEKLRLISDCRLLNDHLEANISKWTTGEASFRAQYIT